jgi:hypothetical protein
MKLAGFFVLRQGLLDRDKNEAGAETESGRKTKEAGQDERNNTDDRF